MKLTSKMKTTWKKDNLKKEDDLKNQDDLKNEYNLKKEDDLKNEDNLKNENDLNLLDNMMENGLLKQYTHQICQKKTKMCYFLNIAKKKWGIVGGEQIPKALLSWYSTPFVV